MLILGLALAALIGLSLGLLGGGGSILTVPVLVYVLGFAAAAVAGALVGTALVTRVPQAALKQGFAVFLLAIGGFVLSR